MSNRLKRRKTEPPREDKHRSSSSELSSLPNEIVLDCLVRVPRRYYGNLSCVSERLRSLVRSPEIYRSRSLLHKDPIYVCFCEREKYCNDPSPTYHWFTLRRTTTEYQLVPISFPSRYFMLQSATIAVDSEIYFIGGFPKPLELWILDTRSGKLRQGPNMQESGIVSRNAVGVLDGKIYVIQELENGEIQEHVFDLESQNWKVGGVPVPDDKSPSRPMMQSNVSLEGKVYAMNTGGITVYNLRQGRKKEKLEMPIDDWVWSICVADNLLFARFFKHGLMWLDTKRKVWRVVIGDVQTLDRMSYAGRMVEYYGKLVVFWRELYFCTMSTKKKKQEEEKKKKKEEKIWCALIALDRVGEEIRGTIEWSGVVATIPYPCHFLHCLVASD